MTSRKSYALAVLVLLIAAGLRQTQLVTLPTGVSQAEWTTLSIVDDSIRAGRISIFYHARPDAAPQPGLYHTVLALVTLVTGDGMLSHRLFSVWAGMVTLALTYTLGVRLFGHLAGLCAMTLLAVMMAAVLLSRAVVPEAVIPLLVTAILMLLARSFPVYRRMRDENTSTLSFAALGFLLGLSFYIHAISLMLVLCSILFTGYFLVLSHRRLMQHLSYIGFALLMLLIVMVPFVLFLINRPENLAALRLMETDGRWFKALTDGFAGLMFRGDINAAHNLPDRPLVDLFSGILIVIGLLVCISHWRQSRFALLVIALLTLVPSAVFTRSSPDFFAFAPVLPVIALLFGTGVTTLIENTPSRVTRRVLYAGLVALLGFNMFWVTRDTFVVWADRADTRAAYNAYAGQLAHYLDLSAGNTPTVLCDTALNVTPPPADPSQAEMILRLMNRKNADIRRVNCLRGMLFVNGGAKQQVILPEPALRPDIHPYIQTWLEGAAVTYSNITPPAAVVMLDVRERLARTAGRFITLSPAQFATETAASGMVMPPVRMGENMTWLGYQQYDSHRYKPGDVMTVITYWRAEGLVPDDVNFFFHVLSDPITVVRQRDTMVVDPHDLRDRDVFVQVTDIDLANTMLPGEYMVSTGAYRTRSKDDERLPVFDSSQVVRGNRLLLYPIIVEAN